MTHWDFLNGFCCGEKIKTDKEDHMRNGQLKPAYNVQTAVENYFTGKNSKKNPMQTCRDAIGRNINKYHRFLHEEIRKFEGILRPKLNIQT